MDSALWELNEGNENEEVGVIIRLHQAGFLPPNVRLITQFGAIATVRLLRGSIVDIRQDEAVASMKGPDFLTPGVEVPNDSEDFHTPSSSSENRRPIHHDGIKGKGTVVGVVDWGCDFTHPNFRHADGTTRLLALWDQSAPYDAERPNRYGYGIIHTAQAINEALASDDPVERLGYFFSRSDPSRSGCHGTHVLDIAAGNGHTGGPMGVAPEADLVFVHLHNLVFPSQVNLGDSVACLEACDLILKIARFGPLVDGSDRVDISPDAGVERPVVINFSMGRMMGPHDGRTLVEQAFDEIVTTRPGRAIVQSTGNYFDRGAHSSGQVLPGQSIIIPFFVSPADITPNELEIWYPGRDVFTIAVRSPNGDISKQTGLDDQSTIQVNDQSVCKVYHRAREPNNLDNNCHVYIENGAPPGRWEVILTGVDVVDGRFNIWIERDATCPHCQSRFEHNYVVPLSTTGSICNGLRTIAVGAYNSHDPMRSLGRFSSSGPTRDGRRKPNLIAPGVQILAARSGPHHSDGSRDFLVRKSGTSMAAPHVAGAVALMFDLANRVGHKLAINDTLNLLLGSTVSVEAEGDEMYRVGNGMLDTDAALKATQVFLGKELYNKPLDIPAPYKNIHLPDASEWLVMNSNSLETVDETTGESDWLEVIDNEIVSQIPVHAHFNHILQHLGLQTISSLRDLFMTFARPSLTSLHPQLARMFDAIAVPGGVPIRRLRPGDVFLRYIPGEGYIHIAFISSDNLLLPAQAAAQGWTLETMRPGNYGVVVEAGAFPHRANQRYARRILDAHGIVPLNQLILRIHHSPKFHQYENETLNEQTQSGATVPTLTSEQILRLRERTRERFSIPGMGVESAHPNYDGWPPYGRFRQRAALTKNNETIPEQMFNALRSSDALNSLERSLRLFEGEGRISRSSIDIPLVLVIAAREGGPRRVFSNRSTRVISAGRDTHPDGVSGLDYLYNAINLFPLSIRSEVQLVQSGYVSGRDNRRAASLPERYLLAGIIVWVNHVEGLVLTNIRRILGQERANSLISSMNKDALRAWISLGFAGIGYVRRSLDNLNRQGSSSGNLLNLILTGTELRQDFHVRGAIVSSARAWMLDQMLGNSPIRETVDEQIQIEDVDEHIQEQLSNLRQRITEIAKREWEGWGRGTQQETQPEMQPVLQKYWRTVLNTEVDVERAIRNRAAWSAAFISWVMQDAGSDTSFRYSGLHSAYVNAAKQWYEARDPSKFWAYRITEVTPEIGDLVVNDRCEQQQDGRCIRCFGTTYDNVGDRNERGQLFRKSHADIVVDLDQARNRIRVIGGNVDDSVGAKWIDLTSQGYLPESMRNGCQYIAVLKPPVPERRPESSTSGSGGSSIPATLITPPTPPVTSDLHTPVPITPLTNWVSLSSDERMRYVMDLLVREYLYPVKGAAGIVGNLWAESRVLPNRVEGSSPSTPMTALDFHGREVEFTAEQVMNRNRANRQGPRLPGVGLAQWTSSSRRAGLFLHTFQGQRLGADILYNMDAQVNYLVTELQTRYRRVDSLLRRANVSLEDASDEVLYNYEVPGSILRQEGGRLRKLPRHDPAVIDKFNERRGFARNALRAYTSSARSGRETDEVLEILDDESVLHQCLPGEGPPAAVPDPEGRGLHPLVYRGTGQLRSRNPTVGDAQQLLNRFLEQIRSSLDSCDVRTAEVQRVISQGRNTLQRSGQDPLIVDCRFGPSTETATKMFQACKGLVQDGKIGPRTWAELVKLRPSTPLNPANFPTSGFSGPVGEPAPRPCCVMRPTIFLGDNTVQLSDLNRHIYGDPSAYPTKEKSGLIYTCKGGFVDLGHSRDLADWTGFLAFRTKSMLAAGGSLSLSPEATGSSRTVQFIAQSTAPSDQVCILLAQRIAYEMAIWHEIITWFPRAMQRFSAFSPEDNYSNLLGTYIGADALRNSKPFEDAVVDAIKDWLTKLKARSSTETRQAFTAVQDRWWQNTLNPTTDDAILRRHFDALGTVTPWLVPNFSPCSDETAFPLDVPATGPGGEVLSSLYRLELGVTRALSTAALAVTASGSTGGPITPNDFSSLIAFIRAEAKSSSNFGPNADQP